MKKCVIFAARPVEPELRPWCEGASLVIAADAGWRWARALGVEPDILLGDYDSDRPPADVPAGRIDRLPAEKDDTDTHYAAKWLLESLTARLEKSGMKSVQDVHSSPLEIPTVSEETLLSLFTE